MPRWTVPLDGAPSSFRLLAALAVGVTEEDRAFVFRSESLDRLTDSAEVRRRVGELIGVLNGLARMADYDFVAVSLSGIVGDDSGKTIVLAMPAEMTWRGGAAVVQQRRGDRVLTRSTILAEVANRDARVEQVLRTLASGADPVNLYRAFELVENDVGARHAVERRRPPRNPMSIAEARAFVMRLVEEWAASK